MAASFRDIKRKARSIVHDTMQMQALYVASNGEQSPVGIRVHYTYALVGDTNAGMYADRHEVMPRIVFRADEMIPARGAIISIDHGEAYRIDNVLPKDDITITAEALRMSASEIAKAFPDGQPVLV